MKFINGWTLYVLAFALALTADLLNGWAAVGFAVAAWSVAVGVLAYDGRATWRTWRADRAAKLAGAEELEKLEAEYLRQALGCTHPADEPCFGLGHDQ